ncbi:MAG: prenyltransferase/squalene oxidase repeat-containing protein [Candidatus Heimdallarchaeaceae archaeon]
MKLKLKRSPSQIILNSNNDYAILHYLKILNLQDYSFTQRLLSKLLKTQLENGSFPSKYARSVGGIKETCRNTHLILDFGYEPKNSVIKSAVDFLLQNQNSDGGWSENPNINVPENIVELSTSKGITWLTADIIELLHRVWMGQSNSCEKARLWLINMQRQDGGWTMWEKEKNSSDPDSTAQILFMLRDLYGTESFSWHKGLSLFEKFLTERAQEAIQGYYIDPSTKEKKRNDIYSLSHLLLSSLVDKGRRIKAGYKMNDSRVKHIVKEIIEIQNEDGGWNPFWKEESDPIYTVLAVKMLVLLKVLNIKEIQKQTLKLREIDRV